ncbi:MAG: hypothetical protein ACTSV7_00125 [Candidatus Baldrarchaeia archaeon]
METIGIKVLQKLEEICRLFQGYPEDKLDYEACRECPLNVLGEGGFCILGQYRGKLQRFFNEHPELKERYVQRLVYEG